MKHRKIWNLPNVLTLMRVFIVPVLIVLLLIIARGTIWNKELSLFQDKLLSFIAALIFALAGLTDLVDGYIARKQNIITTFGKLVDPLADKLLVAAALIMLIPLNRVSAWIVTIFILREIAVTGLRSIAASEGFAIEVSFSGKAKTFFTLFAITFLIAHYTYFNIINFHLWGIFLIWIALAISVVSAIDYFIKFFTELSASSKV